MRKEAVFNLDARLLCFDICRCTRMIDNIEGGGIFLLSTRQGDIMISGNAIRQFTGEIMLKNILLLILALTIFCPVISKAEPEIEAVLCTALENRIPLDTLAQFDLDVERIYLWTRVSGYPDQTKLRHVWLHNGQERADVELTIKADPWRTWSYKTMIPGWAGEWEVKIVGANGDVIKTVNFTFGDAKPKAKETKEAGEAKEVKEAKNMKPSEAKTADSTK